MAGKRKSILLYFDNFELVSGLPDEQLGLLFRALMECGRREADGEDGITGFEQRYPGMCDKAQMAFLFMADGIRRDAEAYAAKCSNLQASARRREAARRRETDLTAREAPEEPIVPPPPEVREQLAELVRKARMP